MSDYGLDDDYDDEDHGPSLYYFRGEWKCRCDWWTYHGTCRHVRWFRSETVVAVNEKYL